MTAQCPHPRIGSGASWPPSSTGDGPQGCMGGVAIWAAMGGRSLQRNERVRLSDWPHPRVASQAPTLIDSLRTPLGLMSLRV